MTLENYKKSCKEFAKDTAEWGDVEFSKFYTTAEPYGWKETCDNAHGGLPVDWAFKRSDVAIDRYAERMYLDYLKNDVQQGLDEDWDCEQWQNFFKRYS